MTTILCVILFVWFTIYSIRIFTIGSVNQRTFSIPGRANLKYVMSSSMYFIIFIVVTAPLFLGSLSLAKYLVFFLCMLYILCAKREQLNSNSIIKSYIIFLIWLAITILYSSHKGEGLIVLFKYTLPLLALFCGYKALETRFDFYYFLKAATLAMLFYAFYIGGFSNVFYPWLMWSPFGSGIFIVSAGLCDYFTSLFVVPLILSIVIGQRKWIIVSLIVFLSQILEVNRTGITGCLIGLCVFLMLRYKWKALPPILGIGILGISIALFVPSVNEKFFQGKNKSDYTVSQMASGELSLDDIQTNGRQYMWDKALNRFYKGHELAGSGLGSTTYAMKQGQISKTIKLIHSDYIQMLCDSGIIALCLFILFIVITLIVIISDIIRLKCIYISLSGILALSSLCGTLMSMGFDNVVSHSMTSMINPYIFIGFYLKFKQLDRNGEMAK